MEDRTKRSAGLMLLDIFLQFFPGFMLYHFASVICDVLLETDGVFSLWDGVWLFLLAAGFYLFRYFFSEFRFFLISHLIWLILFCMVLPRTIFAKVILTMIGVGRSLYGSIKKSSRINERGAKIDLNKVDVEATEPLEGCIALLSLFIALLTGDITVIYPFLAEPIIFYLAYLLRSHLSGRRMYMEQYEHMSHFPLRHMKQTGYLVMGVYLSVSFVCMTSAAFYRYLLSDTGPFIWLWERVKQIIRFLVWAILNIINMFLPNAPMDTAQETAEAAETASGMFEIGAAETSFFWMLADRILRIGLLVLLLLGLITGIVSILLELNRRFQRGKGRGSQTEEYEEIQEIWKPKDKVKRKKRPGIFSRTPEEKIRRIYGRTVKKAVEQETGASDRRNLWRRYGKQSLKVDETLSPLELDEAILLNQRITDEESLRILYEKARYSRQSMDKNMVAQARAAAAEKR